MFEFRRYQLSVSTMVATLVSLLFLGCNSKATTNYEQVELIELESIGSNDTTYKVVLGGCNYVDQEFKMMIQGITLGTRTKTRMAEKQVQTAITKKGAYLHLVLNDSIHLIDYHRNMRAQIPDGQYKAVAFVVKDNHESIKGKAAVMSRDIEIQNGRMVKSLVSHEPRLVYAAPWGIFKDEEINYILLDFYLVNTDLSPQGNKVLLKIDEKKEFWIDKWSSFYIKGLGEGMHRISLELFDAKGNSIYGPVQQQFSCVATKDEH